MRVGLVGTGGMAPHHAMGYHACPEAELVACCDLSPEVAQAFARRYEIPAVYPDFKSMLHSGKIDAVDSVIPDSFHAEVAIETAEAGLAIMSEKPLAVTVAEGEAMLEAVQRAGVVNMVNFTYRNASALQAGHRMIAAGRLGAIRHVDCSYLQSWLVAKYWGDWRKEPRFLWRLSTAHGSGGVLGDIGCHLYDATKFLAGPIERLHCSLRTMDKGVPGNRIGDYHLDANDSMVSTLDFCSGAHGVAHSSRWATGHRNSLRFRVHGTEGALDIELDRSQTHYRICHGETLEDTLWREEEAPATPDNYTRFIHAILSREPAPSDFANALDVQRYLAASEASARSGRWVAIDQAAEETKFG